jgi:hypothetical protein
MVAHAESPNGSQPLARKRTYDRSDMDEGVIDLTRSALKNKKLSLAKKKSSPMKQHTSSYLPATDSDDDFQNATFTNHNREASSNTSSNPAAAAVPTASPCHHQHGSDSDDSFADMFPIETDAMVSHSLMYEKMKSYFHSQYVNNLIFVDQYSRRYV